ncbi:MAG: hypothetical protein QXF68_08700 [Thermofilaceae archaeon]
METRLRWNEYNAEILSLGVDIVLVHDPQSKALPLFRRRRSAWVWRCHTDVHVPNSSFWNRVSTFFLPFTLLQRHDCARQGVMKPEFADRAYISPPSIDPLSNKNRDWSGTM